MSEEKDKFDKHYFEDVYSSGAILKGRRPLQHRFWVKYINKQKKRGRLLDIGCGVGFFLGYAERAYETYGVDISEYAIQQARNRLSLGTKLQVEEATQLSFDSSYFDVVTAFDVLEHLSSPELAIAECYRVLKSGGIFIFSAPNTTSYGFKWKKAGWFGYRDSTHISVLSSKQWSQLLQKSGFNIIDKWYDGLWDSPYFCRVPAFIQHLFFKIPFTILFPLCGTLGIKFPPKWGENVFWISVKP